MNIFQKMKLAILSWLPSMTSQPAADVGYRARTEPVHLKKTKPPKPEGEDKMPQLVPMYNSKLGLQIMPPGLYVGLLQGFNAPDGMNETATDSAPVIGPLEYVRCTTGDKLQVGFMESSYKRRYFPQEEERYRARGMTDVGTETQIPIFDRSRVYYGGKYFSDWIVFFYDGKTNPYQ